MGIDEIQYRLQNLRLTSNTPSKMASDGANKSLSSQVISIEAFVRLQKQLVEVLARQSPKLLEAKVRIEKDPPPPENCNLKATKLSLYYGERENYLAWRTAVLDIFRMDWILFGYDDS